MDCSSVQFSAKFVLINIVIHISILCGMIPYPSYNGIVQIPTHNGYKYPGFLMPGDQNLPKLRHTPR